MSGISNAAEPYTLILRAARTLNVLSQLLKACERKVQRSLTLAVLNPRVRVRRQQVHHGIGFVPIDCLANAPSDELETSNVMKRSSVKSSMRHTKYEVESSTTYILKRTREHRSAWQTAWCKTDQRPPGMALTSGTPVKALIILQHFPKSPFLAWRARDPKP